MQNGLQVIVADNSQIVTEGLRVLLERSGLCKRVTTVTGVEELEQAARRNSPDLIVVNPSLLQHHKDILTGMKEHLPDLKLVGLIYAYYEPRVLSVFDGLIHIHQPSTEIVSDLQKMLAARPEPEAQPRQVLSEREVDVLKLLVTGFSNKEIAEKLFISTHTVISHRKNITIKTGIKTVSGLTIYAVVKNLVNLEQFS